MGGEIVHEQAGSNGTVAIIGSVRQAVIEQIDDDTNVVRAPQQTHACVLDAHDPDLVYVEEDAVWAKALAARLDARFDVDENYDHEKYRDEITG